MNSRQTTTSTLAFAALLSVTLSGCFNVLDRVEANNAGQVRFTTVVEMDTYLFSGDEPADPRTACAIAYEAYKETTPKDDVQYAANAIGMRLTDATAKAAWEVQCTWTSRWFAPLELDERARATLWADPVVQDTELFVSPRKPVDFDDLRKVFEDQMYEKADARRCLEPQPLDLPCDEELIALVRAADAGDEKAREELKEVRSTTLETELAIKALMYMFKESDYRIELDGVRTVKGFTRNRDDQPYWYHSLSRLVDDPSERRYAIALQ